MQPVIFQRGLGTNETSGNDTDSSGVCHADLGLIGNTGERPHPGDEAAFDLDFDNFFFVDMEGNPIDGRKCSVIYEDQDPDSQVHVVLDEDGNVVDMYMGNDEDDDVDGSWSAYRQDNGDARTRAGNTVTADPVTITVTPGTASSKPRPTVLAATTELEARAGSVVTPAPVVPPY